MTQCPWEVRPARSSDHDGIDAFVLGDAQGSIFHRPLWGRAVKDQFGHPQGDLVALEGTRVVGFLPLALCRGLGGGRALISVPYGVYGGPLGRTPEILRALVDQAVSQVRDSGLRRLELRNRQEMPLGDGAGSSGAAAFMKSELYCRFHRTLPKDAAEVLGAIPKKARADVRRAREKLGLTLDEGPWYLPDLVRLFRGNKQALGSPALPASWFVRLLEIFGDAAHIHVVRRGALILSAVMSFEDGNELHAYYSGTLPGADRDYKASSFMYCALQEWAVERGFGVFDFGRSRRDSGAADFKRRQGFDAQNLPYLYVLGKDKGLPSLNPSNPKTAPLRGMWTKLPPGVAVGLGGFASRFLP